MQKIIIEKPYRFVSPHYGTWWPAFLQWSNVYALYLRRVERVVSYECRHVDRLLIIVGQNLSLSCGVSTRP